MLRLDLVYCISFSICHHAGLRLIVWRFLLVKAFKHYDSGCVSCTAYRVCSKSEMRWLPASCCFMGALIRLSVARWLGWRHQTDPEKISHRRWALTTPGQVILALCWEAASEAVAEKVKGSVLQGASCCANWRLEGAGALLFMGSFQHPVVTGPIFKL